MTTGRRGALRVISANVLHGERFFGVYHRATGNGFAGGVGKIAAVIGPILAGALVGIGYLAALVPLAIAFAAGGIVVLAFGRETKGEPLT